MNRAAIACGEAVAGNDERLTRDGVVRLERRARRSVRARVWATTWLVIGVALGLGVWLARSSR